MIKVKRVCVGGGGGGGWKILCYFKFCVYLRILYTFCCILMFVTFVNLFFVYFLKNKKNEINTFKKKKVLRKPLQYPSLIAPQFN